MPNTPMIIDILGTKVRADKICAYSYSTGNQGTLDVSIEGHVEYKYHKASDAPGSSGSTSMMRFAPLSAELFAKFEKEYSFLMENYWDMFNPTLTGMPMQRAVNE